MISLNAGFLFALVGSAIGSPVEVRQQSLASSIQNDLQVKDCKGMTVIFARGTTESGNVGTLAGPPFFQALSKMVGGDLAVQGVDYPADIPGFLAGGDANGSKLMAQLVQQAMQDCPNTKVVMAGYSQGGQLVHNAAQQLPTATAQKVSSAVIFGDPNNGDAVKGVSADQTKVICHTGDNICDGGTLILTPHLTYGSDANEAAAFAATTAGMA
ncbi:cutinase [Pseudomassariella vexata]|uniref:cutinase n=1 Tax=Pseudomassariella vexata TaxID=1141098 RepID=A0A1Y2DAN0_9PEZI|nr:cutinase [Pseudomassariella vexata]ORY56166.1 cutinase [Pseudomassariella vexata]